MAPAAPPGKGGPAGPPSSFPSRWSESDQPRSSDLLPWLRRRCSYLSYASPGVLSHGSKSNLISAVDIAVPRCGSRPSHHVEIQPYTQTPVAPHHGRLHSVGHTRPVSTFRTEARPPKYARCTYMSYSYMLHFNALRFCPPEGRRQRMEARRESHAAA